MKATRKLLAFVMVIAMVMAMAISASAATVTIENSQADATYSFYKILEWEDGKYYKAASDAWKDVADDYLTFDTDGYVIFVPTDSTALVAGLKSAAASHTPDKTVTGTAGSTTVDLDPGYYLMISSVNGGTNASFARITPNDDFVIREKNTATGLPTIEKTMTPMNTQFYVNTERDFTVTVVLDEGDTEYTITDIMTGLELVGEISVSDVPHATKVVTKNGTAGFTVEITFEAGYTSHANTEVTITYKAKVTDATHIRNEVAMNDGSQNYSDFVEETQYSFTLQKTDGSVQIDGAEFVLKNSDDKFATFDANYVLTGWADTQAGATPITVGSQELKGFAEGEYTLVETKVPLGYQHPTGNTTVNITEISDGEYRVNGNDPAAAVIVVNVPVDPLPETGGMGTTLFYTLGGLMVMAATVLLVTKKRMAVK